MRKIMRELQREFPFAKIETTSGSHYRIKLPNGRVVFAAATPSCSFYMKNVRADVRRKMAKDVEVP